MAQGGSSPWHAVRMSIRPFRLEIQAHFLGFSQQFVRPADLDHVPRITFQRPFAAPWRPPWGPATSGSAWQVQPAGRIREGPASAPAASRSGVGAPTAWASSSSARRFPGCRLPQGLEFFTAALLSGDAAPG